LGKGSQNCKASGLDPKKLIKKNFLLGYMYRHQGRLPYQFATNKVEIKADKSGIVTKESITERLQISQTFRAPTI